jgi:ABC-type uncharacterized transport system involved in gliding motility auxiliary subunit
MRPSFSWLRRRQTKYGAYAAAYVLVVFALVALANWAVNRHVTKSWDLTSTKRYSLSDQTRKIVGGLDREVAIHYFDRNDQFNQARDLLENYNHLSPQLSVEYVDPDRKPAIARQYEITTYGTIVLTSGDKREEANLLEEESITNTLIRLLKTGTKNVCFVEGHGEHGVDDTERGGFSGAKEALENSRYAVKSISLLRQAKVPEDCSVVVVAGPETEYLEPEVEALRSFVEDGGRALFMLGPGGSEKLVELLAGWNVELKKDLVIDLNPLNQLYGADATMPIISEYKSHTITRELSRTATLIPFARSVQAGEDYETGITVETLFETSEESWATRFNPGMETITLQREQATEGPIPLAVAGTLSKDEGGNGETAEGEDSSEKKEGRFVVVGSSRFPANAYLGFNANRDLFVNIANWLSSDEDLISVRPKSPEDRRVDLSAGQMRWVFYLSVVGLPLLMVASGVAVWWRRRYS